MLCNFGSLLFLVVIPQVTAGTPAAKPVEVFVERGIELYRARQFSLAEENLSQALRLEPRNARARIYLARTLVQTAKAPQALRELRILLDSPQEDPQAAFQAARLLQELAGSRFARIQRIAPDSAETHELLGRHYEAQGRLQEALAEYRQAVERNPSGPGLHFLVGNIHWKNLSFDAALPELRAELRLNPNHTMANHRVGHIYVSRHQAAEALPFLEKAVGVNPEFLEARSDLGKAYRLLGRWSDALREFSFVVQRRPEDDTAHAQLAAVYKALGDDHRANAELAIHQRILQKRREAAGKE